MSSDTSNLTSREVAPFDRVYVWGNNAKRATLKGRNCRIVARGTMNSILVEFEDGERVVTSRYAVRLRAVSQ